MTHYQRRIEGHHGYPAPGPPPRRTLAALEPRLHPRRGAHAGARARREHRDLLGHQRRLLAPLPYREAARLVTVNHFYPSLNNLRAPVSVPGFRDYSARTDLFTSAAVENGVAMNLTGGAEPERVTVEKVSGAYFSTLGVGAALGRTLQPDEAEAGKDHVVVLTWGFWQSHFGGDRGAVGRTVTLDNQGYQIVGVLPASFRDFFTRRADLFML